MIAYSMDHDPPAPMLPMVVTSTLNRRLRQTLSALVDTGSDITAIPVKTIDHLKLYPIRRLQFEDVHANTTTIFTYKVRLTIADLVIPQIEVISTGLNMGVIGRDVLNRFDLRLYGARLAFEINV